MACCTVLYPLACDNWPCLGKRAQSGAGRARQAWKTLVEKLRVWQELEMRSAGCRALHGVAARDIFGSVLVDERHVQGRGVPPKPGEAEEVGVREVHQSVSDQLVNSGSSSLSGDLKKIIPGIVLTNMIYPTQAGKLRTISQCQDHSPSSPSSRLSSDMENLAE